MRTMRTLLAVVGVCALSLSACGFPTEDSSSPIAAEERPEGLGPPDSGAATATDEVVVWFIRDDVLVRRPREVAEPADAAAVVVALGAGVTAAEAEGGLRSALPDTSMLVTASLSGGTATVQLADEFLEIPPGDQVLALGQVVLTLTDLRGIGRVRFEIGGEAVATPLPDGTSTEDSVSREDFRSLGD